MKRNSSEDENLNDKDSEIIGRHFDDIDEI